MNDVNKKDALTELVDLGSNSNDGQSNNGTVASPSGDNVTLVFTAHMRKLARKILKTIRRQKKEEREVLEQAVKKNLENHERKETK